MIFLEIPNVPLRTVFIETFTYVSGIIGESYYLANCSKSSIDNILIGDP